MYVRFRCLKYWLKDEIRGKTEVFIDNLPGAPDNINLAPDGSFWIDQFHRHLMLEAERKEFRAIIENKSRIILVHTTSGYKYG